MGCTTLSLSMLVVAGTVGFSGCASTNSNDTSAYAELPSALRFVRPPIADSYSAYLIQRYEQRSETGAPVADRAETRDDEPTPDPGRSAALDRG